MHNGNGIIGFSWAPIDDVGSQKEYINGGYEALKAKSEKVCQRVKEAIIRKTKLLLI